jgi:hypothetical protein
VLAKKGHAQDGYVFGVSMEGIFWVAEMHSLQRDFRAARYQSFLKRMMERNEGKFHEVQLRYYIWKGLSESIQTFVLVEILITVSKEFFEVTLYGSKTSLTISLFFLLSLSQFRCYRLK